jgi:peptide/nickel transport system ATP-binding protein
VVARVADRVVVLYAGTVMERAPVHRLFDDPAHPYTRALLACLPGRGRKSGSIPGELPSPTSPPAGCRFAPRCPFAVEACGADPHPDLFPVREAGTDDSTEAGATVGDPPAGSSPISAAPAGGSPGTDPEATDGEADDDHVAACIFHGPDRDPTHLDREAAWAEGTATEPDGGAE